MFAKTEVFENAPQSGGFRKRYVTAHLHVPAGINLVPRVFPGSSREDPGDEVGRE